MPNGEIFAAICMLEVAQIVTCRHVTFFGSKVQVLEPFFLVDAGAEETSNICVSNDAA